MKQSSVYHHLIRRKNPELVSIVIPCFNEFEVIPTLRVRMEAVVKTLGVDVEILLVNDGSCDHTLPQLLEWANANPKVKVISFARNFGHQAATMAGLDYSSGDAVVIMDADLQDPPEVIIEMLEKYRDGYDVVYGQRLSRAGESPFKRATAWAFYRLMQFLILRDLPLDTGDFRLISRECLGALNRMHEVHRFLRGMVAWLGFPQIAVQYHRPSRVCGTTKYPFSKMIRYAWDATLSFSALPLRISYLLSASTALIGLSYGVYGIIQSVRGVAVPGWTSLVVIICLIGAGLQVSIGILGEYVARLYEEAKKRPIYIVSMTANISQL